MPGTQARGQAGAPPQAQGRVERVEPMHSAAVHPPSDNMVVFGCDLGYRLLDDAHTRLAQLRPFVVRELEIAAEREKGQVCRVGPKQQRLADPALAVADDRNPLVLCLISVADGADADKATADCVIQLRKL